MKIKHCIHLPSTESLKVATHAVCQACLDMGSSWVHLRLCQTCGLVHCCDSSPNQHATKHFLSTQHPLVTSAEPGENWAWCYVHQLIMPLEGTFSSL